MERYYRKYYILKSSTDRSKSMTVKALDNNDGYINISITINKKEIRQNLYLFGYDILGSVIFKKNINSSMTIDKSIFEKVSNLAVILEKENACSLEYLQMENQKDILKNFEAYRFKNFNRKKEQVGSKKNNNKQTSKKANDEQANKDTSKNNKSKANQTTGSNQAQDLSEMMKTFSKASSMMESFNNMSNMQDNQTKKEVKSPSKDIINPFTKTFPNSEWIKTEFHGNSGYWHYLSGKLYENEKLAYKAIAVPGEYSMTPPAWLDGFSKFYVCDTPYANGYWIMFTDPQNGNIVSGPTVI